MDANVDDQRERLAGDEAAAGALPAGDGTPSDAGQAGADLDQTLSDRDQSLSDSDQAQADADQQSSDRDQTVADEELSDTPSREEEKQHARSREQRQGSTRERERSALGRAKQSSLRFDNAVRRDDNALVRDSAAAARDRASDRESDGGDCSAESFSDLRARAARDRLAAAGDRRRSALDREAAARDRMFAEEDIRRARLDDLTGAYRREAGFVALAQEMSRASRGDGRLVLAFVDVDGLKRVNRIGGHGAGDALLVSVVSTMRARLRSYDPVVRLGGDEFLCGISDADVDDARHAFDDIRSSLASAPQGGSISAGFAAMQPGDTLEVLIERADADLYTAKSTGEAVTARA